MTPWFAVLALPQHHRILGSFPGGRTATFPVGGRKGEFLRTYEESYLAAKNPPGVLRGGPRGLQDGHLGALAGPVEAARCRAL
jgi:hypothetical protein